MLPRPGERLGDYLLERKLGEGGMGAVYVGVSAGGARRAIKVPFFEEHEADRRERFRREALALSKVPPHRGVVRIHSAGEERGLAFAVLELVEGRPLDALIAAGLPAERAVGLAVEIARALEHVHAAGIVHRDLKPANVLVREDGSPVIVDFGLARDSAHSALTKTGEVVGTPAYMAPEQIDDARLAGPPADVYALGATLYEMLAGRPPFEGTGAQLLKSVLMDAPQGPCARAARPPADLDAGHLDAVVLRALAKTPEARYPSSAALREDLERVRAGEPIKGSAPSALERLRWRLRRAPWLRRAALAGAALAVAAAALGAFLGVSHGRRVAADAALGDALAGARGARSGPREELRRRLALVEERIAGPVSDAEAARRELAAMRAALKLEEELEAAVVLLREGRSAAAGSSSAALPPAAEKAFTAALAHVPRGASARAESTVLGRLASEQLESGDAETALGVLDVAARLGQRCDVGPALALEERTLRARAWARRGVEPFRKNAEALVAFLSSDEGVASLGTFVRALAPGLEGPAADVLVAVDARRPAALPGELSRALAPFFRERARRALDEHVAAPERIDRLRAAVRLTSLAWRANPHEEPPEALAGILASVAVQRSERGDLEGALEAHLEAIRARGAPAMGGVDSRFRGLRKELERRLHVDPGDWPAKLCLGQLLFESGAEKDHVTGLALAREVVADEHVPLAMRIRARERAAEHLLGLRERAKALVELEAALEEDDPMPDRVCLMIANVHVEEWLDRSSADERALTQKWAVAGLEHAIARHERTLQGTLRTARAPDRPPLEPVRPGETVAGRLRLLVVFCAIGDGELEKAAAVAAAAADYEDWRGPLGRASVHFAKGEAAAANAILTPRLDEEARRGMPDALSRLVLVLRYASKGREAEDVLAAVKRLGGS